MININNSKLAKKMNIMAILIFPFMLIKDGTNNLFTKETCKVYKSQLQDFIGAGAALAIILLFVLLACNVVSWWLFLLGLLPVVLQPLWMITETALKGNLSDVSLIRQAIDLGCEYSLPCELKTPYTSFSWFKFI